MRAVAEKPHRAVEKFDAIEIYSGIARFPCDSTALLFCSALFERLILASMYF